MEEIELGTEVPFLQAWMSEGMYSVCLQAAPGDGGVRRKQPETHLPPDM